MCPSPLGYVVQCIGRKCGVQVASSTFARTMLLWKCSITHSQFQTVSTFVWLSKGNSCIWHRFFSLWQIIRYHIINWRTGTIPIAVRNQLSLWSFLDQAVKRISRANEPNSLVIVTHSAHPWRRKGAKINLFTKPVGHKLKKSKQQDNDDQPVNALFLNLCWKYKKEEPV